MSHLNCPTCGAVMKQVDITDLRAIDEAIAAYGWSNVYGIGPDRWDDAHVDVVIPGLGLVTIVESNTSAGSDYYSSGQKYVIIQINGTFFKKVSDSDSYARDQWCYGRFSKAEPITRSVTTWE